MNRQPCWPAGSDRSRRSAPCPDRAGEPNPRDVVMRAFQNLREFLQLLEAEQQLLRISEEVSLEPDLAAAACALTRLGETSPAVHFGNIRGYRNAHVVMNVHGSWPNHALALGIDKNTPLRGQFFEFVR